MERSDRINALVNVTMSVEEVAEIAGCDPDEVIDHGNGYCVVRDDGSDRYDPALIAVMAEVEADIERQDAEIERQAVQRKAKSKARGAA